MMPRPTLPDFVFEFSSASLFKWLTVAKSLSKAASFSGDKATSSSSVSCTSLLPGISDKMTTRFVNSSLLSKKATTSCDDQSVGSEKNRECYYTEW